MCSASLPQSIWNNNQQQVNTLAPHVQIDPTLRFSRDVRAAHTLPRVERAVQDLLSAKMSTSILASVKRSCHDRNEVNPSKKLRTLNGDYYSRYNTMSLFNENVEPFSAYADSKLLAGQQPSTLVKSEPIVGQPEIITLSDSEDEGDNVAKQAMAMTQSDQQEFLVQLKKRLLQEETKLVLLQKLRASLVQPRNNPHIKVQAADVPKPSHRFTPPPLDRKLNSSSPSSRKKTPPTISSSSGQLYQRYEPVLPTQNQLNKSKTQSNPPPLVNLTNGSTEKQAAIGHHAGEIRSEKQPPNGHHAVNDRENHNLKRERASPQQLSAEVKRSLMRQHCRRDLQQGLLNLARPNRNKILSPEVNFIPSLSSAEFVCLVGMEEIVKHIITPDQKDVKYVFTPFTCVLCKTDFTPVWKRDKPSSKNVICEMCLASTQKKALRLEHTTKSKAEFDQAVLREQDYERRILNGSPLSDIPAINAASVQKSASYKASQSLPQSKMPGMPQLTSSHSKLIPITNDRARSSNTIPNNVPIKTHSPGASGRLNQAQLQQQQALMQAQQMNALMAQALVYPQLQQYYGGMTESQMSDIQKQYLLEMINSGNWPTK